MPSPSNFSLRVLDIGTSSTRALLFDDHAQLLVDGIAQIQTTADITPTGDVTFNADALFAAVAAPSSPTSSGSTRTTNHLRPSSPTLRQVALA